jgi:hypothetical protein
VSKQFQCPPLVRKGQMAIYTCLAPFPRNILRDVLFLGMAISPSRTDILFDLD